MRRGSPPGGGGKCAPRVVSDVCDTDVRLRNRKDHVKNRFSLASPNQAHHNRSKWVIAAEVSQSARVLGEHAPDHIAFLNPASDEEASEAFDLDLEPSITRVERLWHRHQDFS